MAIPHSKCKSQHIHSGCYNLLPTLYRAKRISITIPIAVHLISAGIEVANNSPITDKFNLGVIQV